MNLRRLQVKHDYYGIGKIIKREGKYITVSFENVEKIFVIPDAFKSNITVIDPNID